MKQWAVSALLLGSIWSTGVGAEAFITGGDLHELCQEPGEACGTYIMGVMDAMDQTESLPGGGAPYCFSEVSSDEVTEVVTKFLKRHPAKWDSSAASMVVGSLTDAFPCGQE